MQIRFSRLPLLLLAVLLVWGLAATLGSRPAQAQFSVNSTGRATDADIGDGDCDTGNTVDGNPECTLAAAIQEANSDGTTDEIHFDGFDSGDVSADGEIEITPVPSTVPAPLSISETVEIRGFTAPGTQPGDPPTITLKGQSEDLLGFVDNSGGSIIEGLSLVNANRALQIDVNNVTVDGCYLGLRPDGTVADFNSFGVVITGDESTVINNVISGSPGYGVGISGDNNLVDANRIGTTSDGNGEVGNGDGVRLEEGATGNVIGKGTPGTGNLISGNTTGVQLSGGGDNKVLTNRIGTDANGAGEVPNTTGIIVGSNGNVIGDDISTLPTEGNVISGNDESGIQIDGNTNRVVSNTIGLTANASSPLPNGDGTADYAGVEVRSGTGTLIVGNTIAGNDASGVRVESGARVQRIRDNIVGTNSNFADGLGNQLDGIQIRANPGSSTEDTDVIENIVVRSGANGINVQGSYHDVSNNYVGVAPDGTALGNAESGIEVNRIGTALASVRVGDQPSYPSAGDDQAAGHATPPGNGNVIGFNADGGIAMLSEASGFVITQNYVGTDPSGADYGNGGILTAASGIVIFGNGNPSTGHQIGYAAGTSFTDPLPPNGGMGNVVAHNSTGIALGGGASSTEVENVSVRGNAIYQNDRPGIDLASDGTTSNDNGANDSDTGPNQFQNFPIIENVAYNSSTSTVDITYRVETATSNAAYPLTIDFYAADNESSGEGKIYLASQAYLSGDAQSPKTKTVDLSTFSNVTKDDDFVATATDANGNTSEFLSNASPLPVELAGFEATQAGEGTVELTWQTASETGNAGFRVQHRTRSDSGWTRIGFVESKAEGGTATEALRYRFTAEDLSVGTHQFRLKQRDLDGSAHLHDPVSVELRMEADLRLSGPAPNPVRGPATVSFAVKEKSEARLTLYNTLGQRVRTVYRGTPVAGEAQTARFDASGLASGVYFLRLTAGGQTKTRRVTVVR